MTKSASTRLPVNELETLSIEELTKLYNQIAFRKIKKFDSRKDGVGRIRLLMDDRRLHLTRVIDGELPVLVTVDGKRAEPTQDTKIGVAGGSSPATVASPGTVADHPVSRAAVAEKKITTRGRRTRFDPDATIGVLRKAEPKRISGRNPYDKYRDGMTVGQALAAGITTRDLNWDSRKDRPGGAVIAITAHPRPEKELPL